MCMEDKGAGISGEVRESAHSTMGRDPREREESKLKNGESGGRTRCAADTTSVDDYKFRKGTTL